MRQINSFNADTNPISAWNDFFHSGKIDDYLAYKNFQNQETNSKTKNGDFHAGKDKGDSH